MRGSKGRSPLLGLNIDDVCARDKLRVEVDDDDGDEDEADEHQEDDLKDGGPAELVGRAVVADGTAAIRDAAAEFQRG